MTESCYVGPRNNMADKIRVLSLRYNYAHKLTKTYLYFGVIAVSIGTMKNKNMYTLSLLLQIST